jgi:hydrogenase maturation protein HypF
MVRVKVNVTGIVQGVGFRPFVYRIAVQNHLKGYVRNRGDAGVEILLEGTQQAIDSFLRDLLERKPPLAQIHKVVMNSISGSNEYTEFTIYKSSEKPESEGSVVPPDAAICDDCLTELRDPTDPRYEYFFITCSNCGPRFTIIERLPYDRENTTMREFPLCGFCAKEYDDPLNRRFHAQTVACPICGPRAWLTTLDGKSMDVKDPVREAGRLLHEGRILAIKGYGGFHIAASSVLEKPLTALRRTKHRRAKPFAIMARSLKAIEGFAEVNSKEQELLTSAARPVILLKKRTDYGLSPSVAPGLHNVGTMLPYTGLHYMLFDQVDDNAFVMTSANPPNQPIVKDNDEALKTLGGTVDYFLFHNRRIAHRCDDSVSRVHGERVSFIRRSRGYAPAPIMLKNEAKQCVLAFGGELNGTACLLQGNKAFISQHVGDIENLETRNFLEEAATHLTRLTNSHIDTVTCDLHPTFTTTKLAEEIAEQNSWRLLRVQHHHSHAAGLMGERQLDELVAIACDGYGYGTDGKAWGGEILHCIHGSTDFRRLAYLEPQPLLGGDVATRYPLRIAAGILGKRLKIDQWLLQNSKHLPYGEAEAELLLEQIHDKDAVETTSCGRIFDAVAAILGICYERTYEGESAMKLESVGTKGKDVLMLEPIFDGNRLNTTELLVKVFDSRDKFSAADLAYSAHAYIAKGLAMLAVEAATKNGVKSIGFTGGSAVNELLANIMRSTVEAAGLRFVVHESIPPGDGGVSFGQAFVGGFGDF